MRETLAQGESLYTLDFELLQVGPGTATGVGVAATSGLGCAKQVVLRRMGWAAKDGWGGTGWVGWVAEACGAAKNKRSCKGWARWHRMGEVAWDGRARLPQKTARRAARSAVAYISLGL